MILNDAPANEAILSNVGEIGEFRIRNSAKAFSILSSGLYANKIRAVIRELSCNAVDSHVAAGTVGTPFDVHLPNSLEPWFSVRDYGTGLSHDQVTNIYTTYFESTKTASNAFIGALGLGSKSPFSYTDNFTVTAVKDGRKGIYTAFINESGVPSIARMMEEESTEPSGVEVKFSVNERYDFDKFRQEARYVYTYFALRPVVSGVQDFEFRDMEYGDKNIVPGVHSYDGRQNRSVAVMGNISYPIDIPNADDNLGELSALVWNCGLEMHFGIGELDFQASREGLSYIPSTIASIKAKLGAVNAQLSIHIATEADAIVNLWERAIFLNKKKEAPLWSAAVQKYVVDNQFDLITYQVSHYARMKQFNLPVEKLAKDFNIDLRGFEKSRGSVSASVVKPYNEYSAAVNTTTGRHKVTPTWQVTVGSNVRFVINDAKVGATERAKCHWRNSKDVCKDNYSETVFVIEAADKTKPVKTAEFFVALSSPPASYIMSANSLMEKPRKDGAMGKNVTIMRLEERNNGGYYSAKEMVWRNAGKADSFDASQTYYYVPLCGFVMESKGGYSSSKDLHDDVSSCGITGLNVGSIYGVRKGDIEFIKTQKNWINFEDHIIAELAKLTEDDLIGMAFAEVDHFELVKYNASMVKQIENKDSPYLSLMTKFKDFNKVRYNKNNFDRLTQRYASKLTIKPDDIIKKFVAECESVYARYPLLENICYRDKVGAIAEYINLVDASKGI